MLIKPKLVGPRDCGVDMGVHKVSVRKEGSAILLPTITRTQPTAAGSDLIGNHASVLWTHQYLCKRPRLY